MNELVNLIVKKTGIPAATAQTIVNVVIDFLKKKLPAPIAAEVNVVDILDNWNTFSRCAAMWPSSQRGPANQRMQITQ